MTLTRVIQWQTLLHCLALKTQIVPVLLSSGSRLGPFALDVLKRNGFSAIPWRQQHGHHLGLRLASSRSKRSTWLSFHLSWFRGTFHHCRRDVMTDPKAQGVNRLAIIAGIPKSYLCRCLAPSQEVWSLECSSHSSQVLIQIWLMRWRLALLTEDHKFLKALDVSSV